MTEALRKAAQAALDDLQCLLDVLSEAMGTGGWVPTPLQSSFREAWVEAGSSMDALRATLAAQPQQATAQAEPVAWCDDGALAGGVGSVASAATKEYWARGDRVDRETAARLKHPLYAVR